MLIDILSFVLNLLSFIFGVLGFAFAIIYTPYFREVAARQPRSLLAISISYVDRMINKLLEEIPPSTESTLVVPSKPARDEQWTSVKSFREFMEGELIDTREAISIAIDFSSRNIHRPLKIYARIPFYTLGFVLVISFFLFVFSVYNISALFSDQENKKLVIDIFVAFYTTALLAAIAWIVYRKRDDPALDAANRLLARQYCLIDINAKTIRIGGLFGRYVIPNDERYVFSGVSEDTICGLYLTDVSNPSYRIKIFTFPSALSSSYLTHRELTSLEETLNSLVAKGRALSPIRTELVQAGTR